VPVPDRRANRQRIILTGEVPSPLNPPPGCRFSSRCPLAADICRAQEPEFRDIGDGRRVACHFA
jgi:oligopeptide/dipeptide ABC transporter ATP-binding protein